VEAVPIDLAQVDEAIRAAEAITGEGAKSAPVTTVIYAAGVSQRSRMIDTHDDVIERVTNVNLRSAQAVAAVAGRRMVRDGGGRLVFLSSLAAYAPTPLRGGYSAAKSGLSSTAATLRAELAPDGVEVVLVVPGFVRTAISENAFRGDGSNHNTMDAAQASGMDPEDCGRRILRGIERSREEIWVAMGIKGRLALALGRLAPRMQRRLLASART
jgi:short-subunit dehydrogenase